MAMFPVHATAKVVRSVLYVSVVTLSSGVTPAFANAWQLETSYGAQLGFDDNFKLNNVDEDKLEVTSLKASVGLSAVRLSPAIQSSAGIRLDAFSFDDNQSELDDRVDITLRYDTRHISCRQSRVYGSAVTSHLSSTTTLNFSVAASSSRRTLWISSAPASTPSTRGI